MSFDCDEEGVGEGCGKDFYFWFDLWCVKIVVDNIIEGLVEFVFVYEEMFCDNVDVYKIDVFDCIDWDY